MFSNRILKTDFKTALEMELEERGMSIKELAKKAKVPSATIYKITAGGRDPRLSTVKKIVEVLEPRKDAFVAVIAARFLLDELKNVEVEIGDKKFKIKEYSANSIEDCIVSVVLAEKEGALGIVCAPILASVVERIVDIPVAIIKPKESTLRDAIRGIAKKIA